MPSDRFQKILNRGYQQLEDFYEYKPTRSITELHCRRELASHDIALPGPKKRGRPQGKILPKRCAHKG